MNNLRSVVSRVRFIAAILAALAGLALAPSLRAQAPELYFATHPASGTRNQANPNQTQVEAYACVSDAVGNTYVAGSSSGITVWGTNSVTSLGGGGNEDMVLVKYSPAGDVLWVRKGSGVYKESGRSLALDGAGGVYLAGTSTSDALSLSTNVSVYNATGAVLGFLARYDGNGNLLWATRSGAFLVTPFIGEGVGDVWPNSVAVDSSGNPVIAGRFNRNPMFGGIRVTNILNVNYVYTNGVVLTNRQGVFGTPTEDLFLAKFSSAGNLLWATNHGSTNAEIVSSIAIDSFDSIYAAGAFNKFTTLGASNFTNAAFAPFLAKFNSNGVPIWASNLSEPTNNNGGRAWSVVVDSANRPTVSFTTPIGYNVPFRLGTNAFTNLIFGVNSGIYAGGFAQYEANGAFRWMKRAPFNVDLLVSGSPNNFGLTLTRDGADNIYARAAGYVTTDGTTFGKAGIHVLKMTSAGLPLWTNSVTPLAISFVDRTATEPSALPAISLDGSGRIAVVATISGDPTAKAAIGWTNITTAFTNGFGYNQFLFRMESNYVAVAPQFFNQPTNMVFQPPQGLTNTTLSGRAWPVADYSWYMVSNGAAIRVSTNSAFGIPVGTTLAHITSYYCVASSGAQQTTSTVVIAQAKLAVYPTTNLVTKLLMGSSTTYSINATGTTAFSYQWRMNGTNLPGEVNSSLVANYPTIASGTNRYDAIACNAFGCLTSSPPFTVTVKGEGSIDTSYPLLVAGRQVLIEPGGNPVVGGAQLTRYTTNGVAVTNGFYKPGQIAFFYPAGITARGSNVAFCRDPDGKLVVGGSFSRLNTNGVTGPTLNQMARFNTDGTIDPTFTNGTGVTFTLNNTGEESISSIVRLPSGKYLVGGNFERFHGIDRTNIVRLNSDGSVDLSFQGPAFLKPQIYNSYYGIGSIVVRSNGGIVVAHHYLDVGTNLYRVCIAGLTTNGAMDQAFNNNLPAVAPGGGLQGWGSLASGRSLAIQQDGKILLAGMFNIPVGPGYGCVVRFNDDGTLDPSFWSGSGLNLCTAVAVQDDGKVLIGSLQGIGRSNMNGTADSSFQSDIVFGGADALRGIAFDRDKIYVTGSFGTYRLIGTLPSKAVNQPIFNSGTAVRLPNGQFGFTTCGLPGQTLVIQASTNLVNWDSISTNVVVSGCIDFLDTQAPQIPNRYYRVIVQP